MINSREIISPPRSTKGKQRLDSGADFARLPNSRNSASSSDSRQQQLRVARATVEAARAMALQSRLERELKAGGQRLEATESRVQDEPGVVDEKAITAQRIAIRILEQRHQQVTDSVKQLRSRLRALWHEAIA